MTALPVAAGSKCRRHDCRGDPCGRPVPGGTIRTRTRFRHHAFTIRRRH